MVIQTFINSVLSHKNFGKHQHTRKMSVPSKWRQSRTRVYPQLWETRTAETRPTSNMMLTAILDLDFLGEVLLVKTLEGSKEGAAECCCARSENQKPLEKLKMNTRALLSALCPHFREQQDLKQPPCDYSFHSQCRIHCARCQNSQENYLALSGYILEFSVHIRLWWRDGCRKQLDPNPAAICPQKNNGGSSPSSARSHGEQLSASACSLMSKVQQNRREATKNRWAKNCAFEVPGKNSKRNLVLKHLMLGWEKMTYQSSSGADGCR